MEFGIDKKELTPTLLVDAVFYPSLKTSRRSSLETSRRCRL